MRTHVALLLILVILGSGLISLKPAGTQTSPSIPQFTLKLEDDSHYVVNASGTYHLEIKFIDVVIKNTSPYAMYAVVNDSIVKLYYNIHVKGHSQDWVDALITSNLAPQNKPPNDNQTIVKFGLGATNPDSGGWSIWLGNITTDKQIDFQVRGVEGFYSTIKDNPPCWRNPDFSVFNETGRSAWSDTQTIAIQNGTYSESATFTPIGLFSATNLLLSVSIVIAAVVIAVLVSALTFLVKHGKSKQPTKNSSEN